MQIFSYFCITIHLRLIMVHSLFLARIVFSIFAAFNPKPCIFLSKLIPVYQCMCIFLWGNLRLFAILHDFSIRDSREGRLYLGRWSCRRRWLLQLVLSSFLEFSIMLILGLWWEMGFSRIFSYVLFYLSLLSYLLFMTIWRRF